MTGRFIGRCVAALAAPLLAWGAAAGAGESALDPLGSPIWAGLVETELGGGPVVYGGGLHLAMPDTVDDPFSVPVMIKLTRGFGKVAELVLFAENNPIQTAVRIVPHRFIQAVGFDIRLEGSGPVRAAAMDAEGVWHVVHKRVSVLTPGGCSAPGGATAGNIGEIAVRQFDRAGGASRVKLRINHPMDTGLVVADNGDAVPAYYIERVELADESGAIATLATRAALASDPVFLFDLPEGRREVRVSAEDSAGLRFETAFAEPAT